MKMRTREASRYAVTYNPVKKDEGVCLSLLGSNKVVFGRHKQTDIKLSPDRARALARVLLEAIDDDRAIETVLEAE